jgi:hypothetical protein
MKYGVVLSCLALILTLSMQGRAGGHSPANRTLQTDPEPDFLNERFLTKAVGNKPDCDQTYPLPQNYENWTNCKKDGGGSACGGPDQCGCLESQRLITFTCDQGQYHQCYGEQGNGCKGN